MNDLIIQVFKFGAVGLINTLIGLSSIYALMYFFSASPVTANAFGYAIGLIVSYILNRVWTFNRNNSKPHSIKKFILVAAVAYILNLAIVLLITTSTPNNNAYLAQLAGIVFYTVTMFLGCRLFVFPASAGRKLKVGNSNNDH